VDQSACGIAAFVALIDQVEITKDSECDERDHRQHDVVQHEQPLAEYQRRQHQRVLDPLMGPREADNGRPVAGVLTDIQIWRCAHRISFTAWTDRNFSERAEDRYCKVTEKRRWGVENDGAVS